MIAPATSSITSRSSRVREASPHPVVLEGLPDERHPFRDDLLADEFAYSRISCWACGSMRSGEKMQQVVQVDLPVGLGVGATVADPCGPVRVPRPARAARCRPRGPGPAARRSRPVGAAPRSASSVTARALAIARRLLPPFVGRGRLGPRRWRSSSAWSTRSRSPCGDGSTAASSPSEHARCSFISHISNGVVCRCRSR